MTTTGSTPEQISAPRIIRKVKRSILPVTFLLYMFSYMDRSTISYAQLTMSADLGIDIPTYAGAVSIFFIAYVLLEIPSNIIMAKVGAKIWLARIAITWGVITIITGLVPSAGYLFVARAALGIAEAGLFPGLVFYLTFWFLNRDRSRALAGMVFAMPFALIIGSTTAGLILDHVDWFGLQSWRWLFVLQGLPPILVGVWVLLFLADRPSKAKWLANGESRWLEAGISAEYDARTGPSPRDHKSIDLRVMKNPKVLHLSSIIFLCGVGTYGMTFFLPQIVAQLDPGYSATNIGFVGAIPYVCAAIAMLVVARISDLRGNRKGIVMGCLSVSVAGLVLTMVFRHDPLLGVLGLCLLAVGIIGYIPPFWALATEALRRTESAVGLALINSVASAGGFVGPFLIGKVATKDNVAFGLIVPAVCLAVAIVLMAFVKPATAPQGR
jgi:ACS family tartrate transporter-like MFS transporter